VDTGENPIILCGDAVVVDAETELIGGQVRIVDDVISDVGVDLSSRFSGDRLVEFPGCVLIPGLVNAHTHLEMTLLRGLGRELEFPDWIAAVTKEIMARSESFFRESAAVGARKCLSGGVTCIADHSTFGVAANAAQTVGMNGVAYREIFCPDDRANYGEQFDQLAEWLGDSSDKSVRRGWSMHAPYNASADSLDAAMDRFSGCPRSIYVAESADECAYISRGAGLFAQRHKARGIRVTPRDMTPIEYLDSHDYWGSDVLAVHLTQASDADFALLASREAAAVFCPVSNALLGVGLPRIAAARRSGLVCGLGTDSAISNERLDMFEEMRFAVLTSRTLGEPISAKDAFGMATTEGGRAIGIYGIGELQAGCRADIAAVSVDHPSFGGSYVEQIVWQSTAENVAATWAAGRQVYTRT